MFLKSSKRFKKQMSANFNFFVCTGLLALLIVTGCDRGKSAKEDTATLPKIALITSSQDQELDIGVKSRLDQHQTLNQTKYQTVVREPDPANAVADQLAIIGELTTGDVSAMLVLPADSNELIPELKKAVDKGIFVVVIGRKLDAEAATAQGLSVPHVGTDLNKASKDLALALNELKLETDQVAILGSVSARDFTPMHEGFMEGLGEGSLQVKTAEQISQGESKSMMAAVRARAKTVIEENEDLSAILCCDYTSTMGCINARTDYVNGGGERKIAILGFATDRNYQNLITAGAEMIAVIHHNQMAVHSISIVYDKISGKEPKSKHVDVPVELVRGKTLSKDFPKKEISEVEISEAENSEEADASASAKE